MEEQNTKQEFEDWFISEWKEASDNGAGLDAEEAREWKKNAYPVFKAGILARDKQLVLMLKDLKDKATGAGIYLEGYQKGIDNAIKMIEEHNRSDP